MCTSTKYVKRISHSLLNNQVDSIPAIESLIPSTMKIKITKNVPSFIGNY